MGRRAMNFALGILAFIWLVTVAASGYAIRVIWQRELVAAAKRAEEHHQSIQALHEFYRAALERIGNTMQFGTPTPAPATVTEDADPELRIRHAIHEDTVKNGIAALGSAYADKGIHLTEEELREEVEHLLLGHDPSPRVAVTD